MKYYNYSRTNNEFIGEGIARLDPIEKKPVIPGRATIKKPENFKKNYVKCFIENEWVDVEDRRGPIYSIETKELRDITLTELGPVPEGFTHLKPMFFDEWDEKEKTWKGHEENKKKHEENEKANKWKYDRIENYGSFGDQLDMLYWDKVNGTDKWLEHIKTIKNKFPKP